MLRLGVTGGFLAGAHLDFAGGLNCLIGGCGAGKTTAPARVPSLRPRAHAGSEDESAAAPRHRCSCEIQSGQWPAGNRTPYQDKHAIHGGPRRSGHHPGPEPGRNPVPISLDRDQIFSADVFIFTSWNEISSRLRTTSHRSFSPRTRSRGPE